MAKGAGVADPFGPRPRPTCRVQGSGFRVSGAGDVDPRPRDALRHTCRVVKCACGREKKARPLFISILTVAAFVVRFDRI